MARKDVSVFIASASDCDELRNLSKAAFSELSNAHTLSFNVFDWRDDTNLGNFEKFQDEIFKSATKKWGKNKCDILVLLLWYKFGKDTVVEYNRYIKEYSKGALLMACHYNGDVKPFDLDGCGVQKLFDWKKTAGDGWAEIKSQRGKVTNFLDFKSHMVKRISEYKDEVIGSAAKKNK